MIHTLHHEAMIHSADTLKNNIMQFFDKNKKKNTTIFAGNFI
jgi:hypothetical protein